MAATILIALNWLRARPFVLVSGVLGCVCLGLAITLWLTHADLSNTQQRLSRVALARDGAVAALNEQNAAMQGLQKKYNAQTAAVKAAEAQAQKTQIVYRERVKSIEKTVVPKACKAAVAWGRKQALSLAKDWQTNAK